MGTLRWTMLRKRSNVRHRSNFRNGYILVNVQSSSSAHCPGEGRNDLQQHLIYQRQLDLLIAHPGPHADIRCYPSTQLRSSFRLRAGIDIRLNKTQRGDFIPLLPLANLRLRSLLSLLELSRLLMQPQLRPKERSQKIQIGQILRTGLGSILPLRDDRFAHSLQRNGQISFQPDSDTPELGVYEVDFEGAADADFPGAESGAEDSDAGVEFGGLPGSLGLVVVERRRSCLTERSFVTIVRVFRRRS